MNVNRNLLAIFLLLHSALLHAELSIIAELPSPAYSKPIYKIGGISYAPRGGAGFSVKSEKGMKVNVSGLLKHESFWDTRQLDAARDGEVVDFPLNVDLDPLGQDINQAGQFNMLGIQTTVNLNFTGLRIKQTELTGNISVDFRGVNDCVIQALRSINAYVEADGKNFLLRVGHTWIPSFVIDCFPETVSYGAGSPFECFGNVTQITLIGDVRGIELLASLCTEVNEFVSAGPFEDSIVVVPGDVEGIPCNALGLAQIPIPEGQNVFSSSFFRNNVAPIVHIQLRKLINEKHLVSAGIWVRSIKPRLFGFTTPPFKVDERITSVSAYVLAKVIANDVIIKAKLMFIENGPADGIIGGYGIHSINPITDQREYTNLRCIDGWLEFFAGDKIQPGVFLGFFKNLGTGDCLVDINQFPQFFNNFADATYGFGQTIDSYVAIAPRCRWNMTDYFAIAGEFFVYHAMFGTMTQQGKIDNTHGVTDYRVMLAGYYYF